MRHTVLVVVALAGSASGQIILWTSGVSPVPAAATFTGHTIHPGIYAFSGGTAGESFAGQTVTEVNGFEVVTGTPTSPLTLLTPGTNDGVYCYQDELQGMANGTAIADIGEGAVSFLFAQDQNCIGLDINKTNSGSVTLQFFDRAGVAFPTVNPTIGTGDQSFQFVASGGLIAGVTITNIDTFGVSYDDLRLPALGAGISTVGSGCGAVTIGHSGTPCLGGDVTFTLNNLQGVLPFFLLSLTPGTQPVCASCTVHMNQPIVTLLAPTYQLGLPTHPSFSGLGVFVQGADVLAPGGCTLPLQVTLTDALRVQIQ